MSNIDEHLNSSAIQQWDENIRAQVREQVEELISDIYGHEAEDLDEIQWEELKGKMDELFDGIEGNLIYQVFEQLEEEFNY